MQKNSPVLSVDLGGTKIEAALITEKGEIEARERVLTRASDGVEPVTRRIFTAIDAVLLKANTAPAKLHSISVAAAGVIDLNKGIITSSPNLPGWHNIPLKNIIEKKYGARVFIINDARAAALGEHRFGAGKGVNNLIYLTVSTGIGGGIIINGELYMGASGSAGEVGHMTIDINGMKHNCGNTGCWETLASGTAIAREAQKRIGAGEKSSLANEDFITAEKVAAAAKAGDLVASEVIAQAAVYLGVGLVNLVNIFNPEMIILGGGVTKIGAPLLDPAVRLMKERAFQLPANAVRIVPAQLGGDSGLIGAAVFARGRTLNEERRGLDESS